ncbi:TetR/AcrR family transcriptional regulator [Streptomyces sp. JV176]|uniref:TetR/AcrR family transcriptional regulator n=1 Tax=Streptomyces sp. JV176 TaxID=858630 RepID=UPI002E777B8D|nr:TetR/AcrR family transcriptional regulator [Streptomyces sp. JV176]MEE1799911.1 TetR/AcrR family transcriptional regulator [Streptomyces sp. JV176]
MTRPETDRTAAPVEDGRQRKARRTREALGAAAAELMLDRGLADVTVEAIAERADVTRRTFSRHFSGKEDAAVESTRVDGERINDALRARPAGEPPLVAYRSAVREWVFDEVCPGVHRRPRGRELFALIDREPALFAAYERVRIEAQEESVRILADRLGVDPDRDPRPGVVVGAGSGVLIAALRLWARRADEGPEGLPVLVELAYDALCAEAAARKGDPQGDLRGEPQGDLQGGPQGEPSGDSPYPGGENRFSLSRSIY